MEGLGGSVEKEETGNMEEEKREEREEVGVETWASGVFFCVRVESVYVLNLLRMLRNLISSLTFCFFCAAPSASFFLFFSCGCFFSALAALALASFSSFFFFAAASFFFSCSFLWISKS